MTVLSILLLLASAGFAIRNAREKSLRPVHAAAAGAALLAAALAVVDAMHIGVAFPPTARETLFFLFSALMFATILGVGAACRRFSGAATSLDRLARELVDVRERLRALLETAPIVSWSLEKNGTLLASEGPALATLGLSPGEHVGQSIFELYRDNPTLRESIRAALGGESLRTDIDIVDRHFDACFTPAINSRGEVTGANVVAVDITEIRRSGFQLQRTKERFRALVETTSDWVWECDTDGRYTYSSPKVMDLLGYAPEEIVGRTPFDLMDDDEAARVASRFDKIIAGGHPFSGLENRHRHHDGREVVLETSGVPLFDSGGNLVGYRGIDRDITERKRAIERLRHSEMQLAEAQRIAHIGSFEWNVAAGTTTWSEEMCRIFDYPRGEQPHLKLVSNRVHPDDRECFEEHFHRALKTGASYLDKFRIVAADGSVRHIYSEARVEVAEDGTTIRAVGTAQDVTRQVVAEETATRFGRLLDDSISEIYIFDAESLKHLHVNLGARRNLGYTLKELSGLTPMDIKKDEPPEILAKRVEPLLTGERDRVQFRSRHYRKDGTSYPVDVHLQLSAYNSRPAFVAFVLDITDRVSAEQTARDLEEQLRYVQRMELIGTLAGGIAHDFNNILSPILGFADMALEEAPQDGSFRYDIEQVIKATRRAGELVEQILVFSRQVEDKASPIHLHLIVRDAMKLVRASLPSTITIEQNVNSDVGMVLANPSQIQQVLTNLCTNAAYAMRETGGTMRLSLDRVCVTDDEATTNQATASELPAGDYARLAVQDTGFGMDEETLARIFEPFFTTKEPSEGTGLGLSVVHGIITHHAGRIFVDSRLGEGTTVRIFLPLTSESSAVVEPAPETDIRGGERVLLVDDEPQIEDLGRRMLERLGYHVTTASDGAAALRIIEGRPTEFDVVVTDQTMPHLTGMALARAIRSRGLEMPVILTTGFSDAITKSAVREAGIDDLLFKPVLGKTLAGAIRRALENKPTGGGHGAHTRR